MKRIYKPNEHVTIAWETRKPKLHELVILTGVFSAIVYYFWK